MEFIILIRRTLEWNKINNFPTIACENYNNWNNFLKNVDLWNKTYNLNYFEYRQQLKNIALKSWQETKLPIIDDKNFWEKNKNNKNLIILPTDDDDWYHPQIKTILKNSFNKQAYVQWKSWVYDYRSSNYEYFYEFDNFKNCTDTVGVAGSNDYAILCNQKKGKIYYHCEIKDKKEEEKINIPLSIWVHHPASFSWLQNKKEKSFKLNKIKENTIPKEIHWAEDYIKEIRKIDLFSKHNLIKFQ